ncbi:ECF transporter S component [Streptococcus sp. zg-JUN1979]|uniref:ECF transporter S component n=1 Tax=Streptococcus sp. zg-JUN1979 TaxID=3391450 RepID=UPI0039A483DD
MTNTRRLTLLAVLSALSFVLMYLSFPLIPGADFLKLDFSLIPMLLALVLLDLKGAFSVLFLRSLLKVLLNTRDVGSLIGLPMNMVALGLFILAFALLWQKKPSIANYIKASVVGTLVLTLAMVVLNLIYAVPLYAEFAGFDINAFIGLNKYIMAMVIPFNLVEGVILALVFYIVYVPAKPLLERYQN